MRIKRRATLLEVLFDALQEAQATQKKPKGEWKDVQLNKEGNVIATPKIKAASLPQEM